MPHPSKGVSQSIHQRGVVLFIALIALVAMSLAAVALMRSVDTSTIIAGNLSFMHSARSSGDSGIEAALTWLDSTAATAEASGLFALDNATHPFNSDNIAAGYYSSIATPADIYADSTWAATASAPATGSLYGSQGAEYYDAGRTKPTGNTVRYIIQRVTRTANQQLSCSNTMLAGYVPPPSPSMKVGAYAKSIKIPTCKDTAGGGLYETENAIYRITVRVTGPKNTVSYVQAYVY